MVFSSLLFSSVTVAAEPPKPPPPRRPSETAYVESRPRFKLSKDALDRTLATILDDALPLDKRIEAIALTAQIRVAEAVPTLVKLIKRNDTIDVRVAGIWALGEIGDPTAIPALLDVHGQASGPTPRLRYDKTVQFGDTAREMTLPELIEDSIGRLGMLEITRYVTLLRTPASSYTQAASIINLQRSALAVLLCVGDRDERAVDALRNILKSPEDIYPPDFRETAAIGLARVLVARAREFARVQARDKLSDQITELLVDVLVKMAPGPTREYLASALNLSRPEYAVTLLTVHFADGSTDAVRARTIEILGMLRSRESVEALVWALENEKSPALKWRAAFGLGLSRTKSAPAVRALTKALEDSDPAVKSAAMEALARIEARGAVALISPSLQDKSPEVRIAAAKALGVSRDTSAVAALIGALGDKDVAVRATVVAALGGTPSRESLAAVARAAHDEDRNVRYAALRVLSAIPLSEAYEALIGMVSDTDRKIRTEAFNAVQLARATKPDLLKRAVIRLIADPNSPASADACDLADFPKDDAVLRALQAATQDKRPAVRASALRTLQQLGQK